MGFADITNAVLEFVRQHPNWAAFVVFALSFGESLPFISLNSILGGVGWHRDHHCRRRPPHLLDHCRRSRNRGCAWGLAVIFKRWGGWGIV